MNALYWIDVAALCSSAIIAFSLIVTVSGSGIRRILNRHFALFAATEAFWAVCSLLLRLSLWLERGNPELLTELATLGIILMGITLLMFAARYVGKPTLRNNIAVAVGLAIVAVGSIALFQHRIVSKPHLLANGTTATEFSPLAFVLAPLPVLFLVWSLVLLWRARRRIAERYFAFSVFVILIGLVLGGIFELPLPIMSITNTIGVSLIGYGVISRQLFNPLREGETRLEVVNRIAAAVGSTLQIDELIETVYREVTPVFRADAFFIALYYEASNELDFRIQVDEGEREPPERKKLGGGLTSWVIENKRPLLVTDLTNLPSGVPQPVLYGTMKLPNCWLGVPMLIGKRVIGVICVQTYRPGVYGGEEELLLTTIAEQVAVALHNARLYETARQEVYERRQAELVLRESEEKFRNLAEQSPNMIFINCKERVVYANKKCEEIMGYSREEYYSANFNFYDLIAPEDKQRVQAAFTRHLAGKDVAPYEYSLVTKGGDRLYAIINTKIITYEKQDALLGIITDISSRKRTERFFKALNNAVLAMERALSPLAVFSAAGEELKRSGFVSVVFLFDEKGEALRLSYISYDPRTLSQIQEDMNVEFNDINLAIDPGGVFERIVRGRETTISPAQDSLQRLFPGLQSNSVEKMATTLDISKVISAPLVSEDQVFGLLSVQSKDLTAEDAPAVTAFANQMAAAWRKVKLVEDLRASLEELEATQEQLMQAQKMEAVGKLAGGVAHDFNNLLTAIKGYTDLLLKRCSRDDPSRSDLMEVKKASDQAARLTRGLLAFSRKQVLQPRVINLNDVILKMLEMLQRLIGEHIELVTGLQGDLHLVKADPGQMEQVILNLVVNARDAMLDGGKLTLKTEDLVVDSRRSRGNPGIKAGSYVKLSVSDTGHGMDGETKSRLFEPFFTTKEKGRGTGLGLSTVYGIVRQSGGTIVVDSEPNRGTTFSIYLPQAASQATNQTQKPGSREQLSGSETLLLVEDEDMVRKLAERVLAEYGYNVLTASRGAQALEIAGSFSDPIQLLITDVVMPGGMNGRQLAERLRPARPDLKVLYISGYADGKLFSASGGEGELHFLEKPFSPIALVQKARAMLDAKTGTP